MRTHWDILKCESLLLMALEGHVREHDQRKKRIQPSDDDKIDERSHKDWKRLGEDN